MILTPLLPVVAAAGVDPIHFGACPVAAVLNCLALAAISEGLFRVVGR
jgi:hypothetical protein